MPAESHFWDGGSWRRGGQLWCAAQLLQVLGTGGTAFITVPAGTYAQVVRFAGTAGSTPPSDAAVDAASPISLGGGIASTTYGGLVNGNAYAFKVSIYDGVTTIYRSCSIFYFGGIGVGGSGLEWRPLVTLHAWDGSAWRQCYLPCQLNTASGTITSAFSWRLDYALNTTAPSGFVLSVKEISTGTEVGPYSVAGTSTSNVSVANDPTISYRVQLQNDLGQNIGAYADVTPV